MNPIIRAAVDSIQLGWVLGIMTVVFVAAFVFWTWYAYAPSHRRRMDEAAQLPLHDDGRTA